MTLISIGPMTNVAACFPNPRAQNCTKSEFCAAWTAASDLVMREAQPFLLSVNIKANGESGAASVFCTLALYNDYSTRYLRIGGT